MSVRKALTCYPCLKLLVKAKTKQGRKVILDSSPKIIYSVISDIAKQILKGTIPLSPKRVALLKKHKNDLRKLGSKLSLKQKKKIINQKGGLLPGILWPAVSLLANIAANQLLK